MPAPVTIDEDLTFTQAEARAVCQEYVCAICASSLRIQPIAGHSRVFILCPEHGNACLAGRVMKSTVDIRVRDSVENRVVYAALAAHPAVYGSVLTRGIPREDADAIARKSVCSLCGFELHVYGVTSNGRTSADTVVLKCGFCNTNIGLSGWGFISREAYTHVPPVKVREYLKKRSQIGLLPVQDVDFQTPVFDKLGSLTIAGDADNPMLAIHARTRQVAERVKALYGKDRQASAVGIQLLFPSLQSTFSQSLECYNRGAMFARAKKGETGYQWDYYRDPFTQEIEIRGGAARTVTGWRMMSNPVNPETVLYTNARGEARGLQNTGRLRFILPDLKSQTGMPIPGYFEMIIVGDALPGIEASIQNARELAFDNGMTASELPMSIFIQDGRPKLQLDLLRKN